MIYLVSACLLGENCKYSGGNNQNQGVLDFCLKAEDGNDWVVPVCPETMGGLSSPRAPSEIQGGDGGDVLAGRARVVSETGEDLTEAFLQGANCVLEAAHRIARLEESLEEDVEGAVQPISGMTGIFKANSPSCGCGSIYDGTFSRKKRPGDGVAAALLKAHGIPVYTENDLPFPARDEKDF